MHTPSVKIKEDIELPKVITAKQMPEKTEQIWGLRLLSQIHQDSNLDKKFSQVIYKP
jgi:hypothetical protein